MPSVRLTRLVPGTARLSTMFMIVIKIVTVIIAVVVTVVIFVTIVIIVGCNGKRTNQRLGGGRAADRTDWYERSE